MAFRILNIIHLWSRDNVWWRVLLLGSLLAGCATSPAPPPAAANLASHYQLDLRHVNGGTFTLPVFSPPGTASGTALHVYLAGDGRPWRGRKMSTNPTGKTAVAMELLRQDPAPALLLGRPCYYLTTLPANCRPELWTSARYSTAVVASMQIALKQLLAEQRPQSLVLIGYSGGGVLALLLAREQTLPTTVITIASNLDTSAWTDHYGHLPLTGSLNPAEVIPANVGFGQVHLSGDLDQVVPRHTTTLYRERHPAAHYLHYEAFDHRCCWVKRWAAILATISDLTR